MRALCTSISITNHISTSKYVGIDIQRNFTPSNLVFLSPWCKNEIDPLWASSKKSDIFRSCIVNQYVQQPDNLNLYLTARENKHTRQTQMIFLLRRKNPCSWQLVTLWRGCKHNVIQQHQQTDPKPFLHRELYIHSFSLIVLARN